MSDFVWGIKHRKTSACIDGPSEHIDRPVPWHYFAPVVFQTRREAREHIKKHWGYIRNRPDLKAAPHGWTVPVPVKIRVIVEEIENE